MATDPVELIRPLEHRTPLVLDLRATLKRLSALRPSPSVPYLTVCLDWRPLGEEPGRVPPPPPKRSQRRAARNRRREGIMRRPARKAVERQLADLIERHGPRGPIVDSLKADTERIAAYLDEEIDPATHGVIIIACHHRDIFESVPLDVSVTTGVHFGPIPSLREIVHAAEDFPGYAILVADQRQAHLWLTEKNAVPSLPGDVARRA